MKLPAYKVPAYVADALDPALRAILLYGRNEGALRQFCRQFIEKKLGKQPDPLACIDMDEAALTGEPARLAEEAAQIPMFGDDKVIVLRLRGQASAPVQTYLANPAARVLLIVMGGNLTPASKLRQAFEASPHAMALPAYEDDEASIARLVQDYLHAQKWQIDTDALTFLQSRLGNERGVMQQELERLMLYKGSGEDAQARTLTLDDIIAAGADNGLASLQHLVDALLAGQLQKADRLLIQLEQFGNSPLAILAHMRRHLAQLQRARARLDTRLPMSEALTSFRPPVHFTRRKAIETQCRKWSQTQLTRALRAIFISEARCRARGMSARLATTIARQSLFGVGRLGQSLH